MSVISLHRGLCRTVLLCCLSFEEALMSHEPNDILTRVLGQFIVNLKPQTRNLR